MPVNSFARIFLVFESGEGFCSVEMISRLMLSFVDGIVF